MSMLDNCWFLAVVFRPDWDKFLLAIKQPQLEPTDDRDGHLVLEVEEAPGAWYSEMEDAARAGARFLAQHGPGGQYGPGLYASNGDGQLRFVAANHDLCPVAVVWRQGTDRNDLRKIRDYYRVQDQVQALLARPAVMTELKEAIKDGQ